jgi:hypothetical protein
VITLWMVLQAFHDKKYWRRLLLWGVLALLLSQPAVFLLSTAALIALVDTRFRTSPEWRRNTLTAALAWAATFGALYFLSYRAVSHSPYMRAFWSYSFLYPRSSAFVRQVRDAIYTLLAAQSFDHVRAGVLAGLFAVGLCAVWRRYGWRASLIAGLPFVEVLGAAALKQYPIAIRLALFILPLTFWVYATGLVSIADLLRPSLRPAASAVLAGALLAPTAIGSIRYIIHFPQRETSERMVSYMRAVDPSAPVYIAFDEYLQWAYYGEDGQNTAALKHKLSVAFHSEHRVEFMPEPGEKHPTTEIVGAMPAASADAATDLQWASDEAAAILQLGRPRAWLFVPVYMNDPVMGHTFRQRKLLEKLQDELNRRGARLEQEYSNGDSTVLLYNLPRMRASMPGPSN